MTRIACLGWGSLVWDPRQLPLKGDWQPDGPDIRVEFLRKSDLNKTQNGRITLVLDPSGTRVPSLWAEMNGPDRRSAVEALRKREGSNTGDIGVWSKGRSPRNIAGLPAWARERGIDTVIWTNLDHRSGGRTRRRSKREVVRYLQTLTGDDREAAECYVRCAPRQIVTEYRLAIEAAIGWTAQEALNL